MKNKAIKTWLEFSKLLFALGVFSALLVLLAGCATMPSESGFASLFDGETLNGWTLAGKHGAGYGVTNGVMFCARGGGGNLFTEREYSDFVLRLEYKLENGGNNGVGIRAPLEGDTAYSGMEIQMLDDQAPKHANIKPWQFNGSVYNIVPATNGTPKIGEWNAYEITARGRRIKVVLNGRTIVDTDLNAVHDPQIIEKHPGMFRDRGHIGFLGHNDYVEFRHIRIKELPVLERENTPPAGFVALFNGKDLTGWKGLLARPNDNPANRAKLSPQELAREQAKADQRLRDHWKADKGEIVFDGKGDSLATSKDYGDFEMLVDWKIPPRGDSGIYLRGTPQAQIWEPNSPGQFKPPDGSGGLYNNKKNPRHPLKFADHPVGEWNRFRIVMVGEKVHVFLNHETVVRDTILENYWEPEKPIYSTGQLELQNHGGPLWFKNIYIREIPRAK
jgi:3-keto-disaccharide hydrolase